MSNSFQLQIRKKIYVELLRKKRLYAWSGHFSETLELIAKENPDTVVYENFGGPRQVPDLAAPPIAVAYIK